MSFFRWYRQVDFLAIFFGKFLIECEVSIVESIHRVHVTDRQRRSGMPYLFTMSCVTMLQLRV